MKERRRITLWIYYNAILRVKLPFKWSWLPEYAGQGGNFSR